MDLINLSQKSIGFLVFPLIKMNVPNSKKEKRKEKRQCVIIKDGQLSNSQKLACPTLLHHKYTHIL